MANLPSAVPSLQWEQELEADRVGPRILFGKTDLALQDELLEAYIGADFFFQVMSLEEIAEIPPSDTHPPSKLRLERLRDYANLLCVNDRSRSQLFDFPKYLELLFSEVREAILKPSLVQIERARQIANMAREKLEQLLEVCANGKILDYSYFNEEVMTMFNKYPFFAVCAAVASSIDKTERYIQVLTQQESSQRDWDTYIVAYQKFKLLINFLYLTPLPYGVNKAIESKRKARIFKR
jgi:hypothetical protein